MSNPPPEHDPPSNILLQSVEPTCRQYVTSPGVAVAVSYDEALDQQDGRFLELVVEFIPAVEVQRRSVHALFELPRLPGSGVVLRGVFEIVSMDDFTLSAGRPKMRDSGFAVDTLRKHVLFRHDQLEGRWQVRRWVGDLSNLEAALGGWVTPNSTLEEVPDWERSLGEPW